MPFVVSSSTFSIIFSSSLFSLSLFKLSYSFSYSIQPLACSTSYSSNYLFHCDTSSFNLDLSRTVAACWVSHPYSCNVEDCEDYNRNLEVRTCDLGIRRSAFYPWITAPPRVQKVYGIRLDLSWLLCDVIWIQSDVTWIRSDVTWIQCDMTWIQSDVKWFQHG